MSIKLVPIAVEDFNKALEEKQEYPIITADQLQEFYEVALKYAQIRSIENVSVQSIMTRDVITVTPDQNLADAARLLLTNRIAGLPVVNDTGHLSGILTEADLLVAIGISCHHPGNSVWHTLDALWSGREKIHGFTGTVGEIMSSNVLTVHEHHTIQEAIQIMKKNQVKRLVVVDGRGIILGIITRSDIIRLFLKWADHVSVENS